MKIETVGPGSFEEVLAGASTTVRETALALRRLIAEIMPGVTEVAWPKQKTVGYGVGPKKMSEHFCYLALHTNHVNLGFFYGTDLDDPKELLEGTGKSLRHVKLASPAATTRAELRHLIERASKHLPKLGPKQP